MKVVVVENNYIPFGTGKLQGWYLIADSAVTNTGKPFYLPEGKGLVTVSLGAGYRISRLGKAISRKFAGRYYSEMAPTLHFKLPDFRAALMKEGMPADASVNFDKSLFVGEFYPKDEVKEIKLLRNGEATGEWREEMLINSVDEEISEISRLNTVKMGDLILPGLTEEMEIKEGDRLDVMVNGEISFQVRVK